MMKHAWMVSLWLLGCSPVGVGESSSPLIFGRDDRRDVYDHEDGWLRDLARNSTVTLMVRAEMDATDPSDIRFGGLGEYVRVCPGGRFNGDPGWGFCSGTLIDDDLVLTAGHCAPAIDCSNTMIAFNYLRDKAGVVNHLTTNDVFACKNVVARQFDGDERDYAIIQLDRRATPRYHPMPLSPARESLLDRPIALIGSPTGMPLKIDDSGVVYQEEPSPGLYVWVNNDGFHGDSGGPIIDLTTYRQVGMMTGASLDDDYVNDHDLGCNVATVDAGFLVAQRVGVALGDFCAGAGSTNLRLCGRGAPANDTPAGAEEIFPRFGQPQVMTGDTSRATSTFASPCSASLGAPDVFFQFTLGQSTLFYADSFSSDFDTILYLTRDSGFVTPGFACGDDACATPQSQITQVLPAGTYYLGLTGWRGASGHYNLHVQTLPASANTIALPSTSGAVSGNTSGGTNSVYPSCASGSAPENTYFYLTCPGASTAPNQFFSTCGNAAFDTVLEYRNGNALAQACVDDTWGCGTQSSFYATATSGAGLRAVSVDGYGGAAGPFTLQYALPVIQVHPDVTSTTPTRGSDSGPSFTTNCPAGMVMVGLHSLSNGSKVDWIAPICQTVFQDGSLRGGVEMPGAGVMSVAVDAVHLDHCPPDQFVVGIRGRAGSRLEALGIQCAAQYPWLVSSTLGTQFEPRGGTTTTAFTDLCYGGTAVTGLSGQLDPNAPSVIRASCVGVY